MDFQTSKWLSPASMLRAFWEVRLLILDGLGENYSFQTTQMPVGCQLWRRENAENARESNLIPVLNTLW